MGTTPRLTEFYFPVTTALAPSQRGLKVLGVMDGYSKSMRSELEEEHIPISLLRTLLK